MALLSATHSLTAEEALIKSGDKIAFLGDSITQGGAAHPGGYVQLVISGLQANDIKVDMMPAGIGGHKSNQMLERLERDVISKKPTWMTLSCGVNDVWHGPNGVPLPAYKKNITEIVDKAQAAGIKVMILTATMIGEEVGNDNNKKLAEYNAFLRELAAEKKCSLADLNADMQAAIKPAGESGKQIELQLTSDGVHMGPLGDRLMAYGILKAFGLSEAQLKKADDAWLNAPRTAGVAGRAGLTLRQYQQLSDIAFRRGKSVSALLNEELQKTVDSLIANQPASAK
jgi:lysophospholipase L1-like esterase